MRLLIGRVDDAPEHSHGFDCNTRLNEQAIKDLKAAGFSFAVRYVARGTKGGKGDLDTAEAERILAGGLGLMVVQHVESEPWSPTEQKGTDYGKNAAAHAIAIGIPPGVSLWLDLEGVSTSVSADVVKSYCNAWFAEVRKEGYEPGVYVGSNAGLDGDALYYELTTKHYWRSGSKVPDIPVRGYCMTQRIKKGDEVGGIEIDRNVITDKVPHPKWVIRFPDEAGDVPVDLHGDILASTPIPPAATTATSTSTKVNTQLPQPAVGLSHHYDEDRLYGTKATIDALLQIGRIWDARRPGAKLSIGDISQKNGGPISGHKSHQLGIDLDMRMMKSDGNAAKMLYTDSAYSQSVTQELVDLFYGNGVLAVKLIFFNDSGVTGVQPYPNHANHLHVRFYKPGETSAFPLLARNDKGAAVRELQRRLRYWIAASGSQVQTPAIDGDFGKITHDAVVAFQQAKKLKADGKAGEDTWKLLPVSA